MVKFNSKLVPVGNYLKLTRYGVSFDSESKRPKKFNEIFDQERYMSKLTGDETTKKLETLIARAIWEASRERKPRNSPTERKLSMSEIQRFHLLFDLNFDVGDKYITLTYERPDVSVDDAGRDFDNWTRRMRDRYGNYKYLAVRSFQQRGTIHFHVLATIPSVPKGQILDGTFRGVWGHGNIDLRTITTPQIINRYAKLKKYFVKNLREFKADDRSYGKRLFLMSRNLITPITIKGQHDEMLRILNDLGIRLQELESHRYTSDHVGYVERKTYRIHKDDRERFESVALNRFKELGQIFV